MENHMLLSAPLLLSSIFSIVSNTIYSFNMQVKSLIFLTDIFLLPVKMILPSHLRESFCWINQN